jgi:signal peptidase II
MCLPRFKHLSKGKLITLLVVSLLIIDQIIKFVVKTNMSLGESIHVIGNWFQIYFIENNGMAFGMQFGGAFGKLLLTTLRFVLIGFIIYYIAKLIKKDAPAGVLIGISLVLVGAVGNLVDSIFYGVLFDASTFNNVSVLLPAGGGYAPLLHGKVVDMFYFPLVDTILPDWMPLWGGERFIFFRPIFNFADSCITVGVFYLIFFQRHFFKSRH